MGNTKKVGSTGKYGSRYGVSVKKRYLKVDEKQRKAQLCPFCGFERTSRIAAGLFLCSKCGARYAGGAYLPETLVGKSVKKMVSQKAFLAGAQEIIKIKESSFADIEKEVANSLNEPVVEKKEKKAKKASSPAPAQAEADEDVEESTVEEQ